MKDTYSAKGRAILRLDREKPVVKVKNALDHEAGVTDYDINYVNNYVRVEFDPRKATIEDIQKLVHK
jgi:copper chaperone CopZ